MKTSAFKNYFFFLSFLLVAVGCQDNDYYDESNNRAEQADLFTGDVSVSDAFNWATTKTIDLSVVVNDQYNGAYNYLIEVYNVNPLFTDNATLLGAGVAKSGKDFVSKIVVPSGAEIIYILQTDPTGAQKVTSAKLGALSAVSVNFNPTANLSASVASLRSTSDVVPGTPSNTIDVTASSFNKNITAGNSYVIPAGKEYRGALTADWTSNGYVFVEGTWVVPSDVDLIYYILVIQPGGHVKFENENSTLKSNGGVIVAGGGEFGKGNVNIGGDSNGPSRKAISNYGTLNAATLTIHGSSELNNYADISIDKIEAGNSSNTIIKNSGTLTTKTINFGGSGASIANNCIFVVTEKMTLRGTTVDIAEGCLLSATTIDVANTTFNLFSNAMLVANTIELVNAGATTFKGVGQDKALVQATTFNTSDGWWVYNVLGNLALATTNYVGHSSGGTISPPAYMVNSTNSTPNIQATSCNGDGNPVQPGVPIIRTLPKPQLSTFSYAFEDNWPTYGDYDLNDFVVDVSLVREQDNNNKLTKLTILAKLRAVGAARNLGAAIQLDGVAVGDVKSVVYSNPNIVGQNFPLRSSGVELGQTYAVIPLCDDAHKAFGFDKPEIINTLDVLNANPVELTITIEFNSPINLLTNDDLNVFIVTGGFKGHRTEVHLNGRQATDKVNRSQFISKNLKSEKEPYRSHENLVWGLCVADSFDYPKEGERVTEAYSQFKNWVETAGAGYTEWYKKSN